MGGRVENAAERLQQSKDLAKLLPETQPATRILPGLAFQSEIINEITPSIDPLVSDLLAYGQVSYSKSNGNREQVPIAAVAGGPAGGEVRLLLLQQEHLEWEGERSVYLRSVSAKNGKESIWRGNGSPIQQIVFAESESLTSTWLAVRYHGAISILRPRLKRARHLLTSHFRNYGQDCLDPNSLVDLPIKHFRGVPFADVAFNPWNHQQIAVIDLEGHWSTWNIQNISTERGIWTIENQSIGCIFNNNADSGQPREIGDGWGRVLWAGATNKLVVASRKIFAVYIVDDDMRKLDVPDLFSDNSTNWIVDIKRDTSDSRYLYLLTSTTLYLINVPASTEPHQSNAQVSLSWRHSLNQDDTSLRLHVLPLKEDMTVKVGTSGE